MQKTYVLDTNVLIQSPHALLAFEENKIVLPIAVLEDLDKLKNEDGDRGTNARQSIRFLEQLRNQGNLFEGVGLETGGLLKIEPNFSAVALPYGFQNNTNDNRILKVCKGLIDQGEPVILVTKDIILRLKSQMLNISTEDYFAEQSPVFDEQYTGRIEVYAPDEKIEEFKKKGILPEHLYILDSNKNKSYSAPENNQFFIIHSDIKEKKTFLGRFNGKKVVPLKSLDQEPFGVKPKNVGQHFLQEALLQDAETAPLVIVKGAAGTAKTFYALAAGLHQTLEHDFKGYRRILVTRPNVQFDDEIGFLPGSEQEKISPLLRPVIDNLEVLLDRSDKSKYQNEVEIRHKIEELFERGVIKAEAMNFIRGRSITHTFLIIDEAQNLTPKQVKGIITRVGKGTKVVLLGDPQQIDHPLLDEKTNGLSYASEKMKGSPLCFQLTMLADECLRSPLAFDAARRM